MFQHQFQHSTTCPNDMIQTLVPSSRYLGLLVKGAQEAGLDPNYIEKLSKQPTYKPNDAVLKVS